jgi:hypothetical protein
MQFCGMSHRLALVRTDDSEERIASIIRVTRIGELVTTLVVTSNGIMKNDLRPQKALFFSVITYIFLYMQFTHRPISS